MNRVPGPLIAWAVGWVVCMVAIVTTNYDGIMTLFFGPIVAAVVSGFVSAVAWVAGFVLRLPPLARAWRRGRIGLGLVAVSCLALMAFGSSMGLTDVFVDPDTGRRFVGLHPAAALSGYFVFLFILANWPVEMPEERLMGPKRCSPHPPP